MKNLKIENLRFIAIIFVVLGHSIIIYNPYWGLIKTSSYSYFFKYLCWFIYVFHMPLFVFISGFLFNGDSINLKNLISKKIRRLLIPYLSFALLYLLPIRYFLDYKSYTENSLLYNVFVNILLGKDNGHLWFLPSLFLNFILFYILSKKITDEKKVLILSFIISILGFKIPYYIGVSMQYFFWFCYGHYISSVNLKSIIKKKYFISFVLFILFFAYIYLYGRFNYSNYICLLLKYIINILFLPFLYHIIPSKSNKFILNISKYSFGIYLFHSPLIYFTFYSNYVKTPFIVLLINFVFWGIISYILSYFISNSKMKFLIGK